MRIRNKQSDDTRPEEEAAISPTVDGRAAVMIERHCRRHTRIL